MHIDLPLHNWHCPRRLFEKMVKVAENFLILFVKENWTKKLFEKLSHPLWFQSLGCYLGFDWHSSWLTTVIWWVLSQALKNINYEIWIYAAWWKWQAALKTPLTIENLAYKYKIFSYNKFKSRSRILAKIDNCFIQDWFNLYYHTIFFDNKGNYVIIQQWLNSKRKLARRYHRSSNIWEKVIKILEWTNWGLKQDEFYIASQIKLEKVLNLISSKSDIIRKNLVDVIKYIQTHYRMPDHHIIRFTDFDINKLIKILSIIKNDIWNLKDLINIKWIWPKAIFNLVQTTELIYWNEADRSDPARFSFTHWGKDWTPYFPKEKEFNETIKNLEYFIEKAKNRSKLKKVYLTIKNTNLDNKKQKRLF